jgi:hypothetical protein
MPERRKRMSNIGRMLFDDDIGKKYLLTDGNIVEYRCELEERVKKNEPLYKHYLVKLSNGSFGGIWGDMIISEVAQ